jgi:hypothetical protein
MIVAPLAGMVLVVTVAAGPINTPDPTMPRLSAREKTVALQPLVQRATECIVAHVAADRPAGAADFGDLIVASIPSCLGPVRALIDAHDRYFGDGTGEAFFMGPYLDVLPSAVLRQVKGPVSGSSATRHDGTRQDGATGRP